MIVLNSTTLKLQLALSAGTADVDVSYNDRTATSYARSDSQQTAAVVGTQDICASPASSTSREIDLINVQIRTTGGTVTIKKMNSSGSVETVLIAFGLVVGDTLRYTHAGAWACTDLNGNTKTSAVALFDSTSVATQAEQETGTSTTKAVTPGRQQYHQSACKAWAKASVSGSAYISYNVTSITDVGTGSVTYVWNVDFSSADFVPIPGQGESGNLECRVTTPADGSAQNIVVINCVLGTATDPDRHYIAAFGDQ